MLAAGLGFLVLLLLILARVPIALALGMVGFVGFGQLVGWPQASVMVAYATKDSTMSYGLIIIPLFILMGNFVAGTGISADLFQAAQRMLGGRRGGLAEASVVASAGLASVCGSSVATVVTMGKVAMPSMKDYRYSEDISAATIAAGATLGILIPPSVLLVIYGIITETHIGKLYAAGLIPGLLGVLGYLLAVRWVVVRKPESVPAAERFPWREKFRSLGSVWPALALFVMVIGGIYGGLFTAIEAAGAGAFGAFILALARGKLSVSSLLDIAIDSARTSVVLFAIIIGSAIFTEFLNYTGVHESLLRFVSSAGISPVTVIVVICFIYIVLGMMMEPMSMILLTVPLFFPIVVDLGFDPVWFGILLVVLCELGLITPPIGINLFVMHSIIPHVPIGRIMKGVVPFIMADVVRVVLIAAFPVISLFLPNLLF